MATYWFDPGKEGELFSVTIAFSGRRVGAKGKPRPGDRFAQEQTVQGIVPGSGPVAVTTEVRGINPGTWNVTARAVKRDRSGRRARPYEPASDGGGAGEERRVWPRRLRSTPAHQRPPLKTALLPFARIPGLVPFVWPALVLLGVALGFAVQALLVARAHGDVGSTMSISGLAVLAGWIGAKAWYVAVHRGRRFDGWCVQGAILGGAAVAAAIPIIGPGITIGAYLNAAAPGLMLGLAAGRPGCFWAGCCTGRPTASRWGVWSSDRHLGIRRVPTQFMESVLCLAIGLITLLLVLIGGLGSSGAVFIGAVAAYTLGRQLILPLRAEPRQTSTGRVLILGASAAVLVADVALAALR